ncbi:MAG: hypothetical protein KJ563_01500 [Candidatus Thermoplasmatota archaeon]|nr:hypothetical protein [Candidatus Thermoplasmatota archaeon]
MSEENVNVVETNVGKKGLRRVMSRRKILIVAIVASILIVFVLATCLIPVSKLTITFTNSRDYDLRVEVWIDGHLSRSDVLEPQETASFQWNVTGWLHKYFVIGFSAGMLVNYFVLWTYIIILPFTEKTIVI